jgi:hypothetical protein
MEGGLTLILAKTVLLLKTNVISLKIVYVSFMIHKRDGEKMLFI